MKKSLKYGLFALFLIVALSQKSSAQITLIDPKLDVAPIASNSTNGSPTLTHTYTVIVKWWYNATLSACKVDTTLFTKRFKINN